MYPDDTWPTPAWRCIDGYITPIRIPEYASTHHHLKNACWLSCNLIGIRSDRLTCVNLWSIIHRINGEKVNNILMRIYKRYTERYQYVWRRYAFRTLSPQSPGIFRSHSRTYLIDLFVHQPESHICTNQVNAKLSGNPVFFYKHGSSLYSVNCFLDKYKR